MNRMSCKGHISLIICFIFGLLFLMGCQDKPKKELQEIQTIIEVYPDSALRVLESFDVQNGTAETKALYKLLITQARYKNFINEDNDSLIREAADFFLSEGDAKNGGLSLFLMGMIQCNMEKFGEAAICFEKGVELSRQYDLHNIEGLCARGLYKLYVKLYDGAQQIKYAKASYEAFLKDGDEEWANYARLDLATAYNNSGQYERAILESMQLSNIAKSINDTILLAESIRLMALSQFAIGNNIASIKNYVMANNLDDLALTENDKNNILIAVGEVEEDSVPKEAYNIITPLKLNENVNTPFEVLAKQGRYKEAYINLEKYKMDQDKILSSLLKSNVSEAIFNYEKSKTLLHKEKLKRERLWWLFIVVVMFFVGISIFYVFRKKLQTEKNQQESIIKNAECLRTDLLHQLETNKLISASLKTIFKQKYSIVDKLCAAYYESQGVRLEKKRIVSEVELIIKEFSNDTARLEELETYADNHTEGVCSSFRVDFPNLKDEDYRMFLYLLLGFSARSISLFFNEKIEVIYNRKSRLKSKIRNSSVAKKDIYLSLCV